MKLFSKSLKLSPDLDHVVIPIESDRTTSVGFNLLLDQDSGNRILSETGFQFHNSKNSIITPAILQYGDYVYASGAGLPSEENPLFIFKYDIKNETLQIELIDGEATAADPITHRYPSILRDADGYLYATATNAHNTAFQIFKTLIPDDISTFQLINQTSGSNGAYPTTRLIGSKMWIYGRSIGVGGYSPTGYLGGLWSVDLETNAKTYTPLLQNTSAVTGDRRIYPAGLIQDIRNSWYYVLFMQRIGATDAKYVTQYVLKTTDYNTFWNIDETYSHNVGTSGVILEADRSNFAIRTNGESATPISAHELVASVVDDVFVSCYLDVNGDHYMQWYNGTWNTKNVQSDLNPRLNGNGGIYEISKLNGKYYIIVLEDITSSAKLYETEIPFNSFTLIKTWYKESQTYASRTWSSFCQNIDSADQTVLLGNRGDGDSVTGYTPTILKWNHIINNQPQKAIAPRLIIEDV
jgi:hypothetical protein